jgi:hypothetical protein
VFDVVCTPGGGRAASDGLAADLTSARKFARQGVKLPANPFDIVWAANSDDYASDLDLNRDRIVDMEDVEIAVAKFGGTTVDGFVEAANAAELDEYPYPDQGPHTIEIDNSCYRCHALDGLPGGLLSVDGQENLCLSCHTASGVAMNKPISAEDIGNSHPRGIAADSGDVLGPDPDSYTEIALHLDDGNIRCGTCHDPMTSDAAAPYLRASIGDADLCGECHIEGDEWALAGHSDRESRAFTYPIGPSHASCVKCHSGLGHIDYAAGLPQEEQRTDEQVHSCFVCHGVHENSNDELLRDFGEVTLPGDHVVDGGLSAGCMECHNGRRTPGGSSLAPHYALGAVMLEGVNGDDFGATLTNSRHRTVAGCTDCHMADTPADETPGAGKVGGHTFNMTWHNPDGLCSGGLDDGQPCSGDADCDDLLPGDGEGTCTPDDPDHGFENFDNACNAAACHGDTDPLTTFDRPAYGDFDGNLSTDGVQTEVLGLLELVFDEIHVAGGLFLGHYPYWQTKRCSGGIDDGEFCTRDTDCDLVDPDDGLGACVAGPNEAVLRSAIWNYEYVDNDGSLGIHNTDYAVGLLQVTYEALTGDPIEDADLRYSPGFGDTIITINEVIGSSPVEPGGPFSVEFTIEDEFGDPVSIDELNRIRLYVSGPAEHYQRVIAADSDLTHYSEVGGTYTYTAVDPFPSVYLAPLNDSLDLTDEEWTGLPLIDGTYTVLIEARRVFAGAREAGDATFDFVVDALPLGPPALAPRQVVTQDACNACHLDLQIHGSNRFSVTGCVICHTRGAEDLITDPVTTPGVTIELGKMIHKIHSGHDLRYVAATANGADPYLYEIIGYRESVHDFSEIGFPYIPTGVTDCDACHGGAAQGGNIYTSIGQFNCASCHDDIDFTVGTILDQSNPAVDDGLLTKADLNDPAYRAFPDSTNHTLPDDSLCAACHGTGMMWDIAVEHRHSTDPAAEGTELAVEILSVAGMTGGGGLYFQAGDFPEVTFKLTDNANDPLFIPAVPDTTVVDRLYFMVVGPTTLYQQIIPDERAVNGGAVTADPANWTDHGDGTYTYKMVAGFPVDYPAQENALGQPPAEQIFPYAGGWGQQYDALGAPLDTGTYSVMVWGRRVTPSGDREPMMTDVFDVPFGADDPIVPWPATVTSAKCNACHSVLAFHGNQREGVQLCAGCHAAGAQNVDTYNGIELRRMVHKLHNAQNLTNLPYELHGHSGLVDFSHLLISAMPGEAAECEACHANDDWKNPPARDNMRTWMVACTSCHDSAETAAHADAMTTPGTFEELCTTCHGDGAAYSVETVHQSP